MRLTSFLAKAPGLADEFVIWIAVIAGLLILGPLLRLLLGRTRRPVSEPKAEKGPA